MGFEWHITFATFCLDNGADSIEKNSGQRWLFSGVLLGLGFSRDSPRSSLVKDDGVRSNLLFVMLVEVMSFLLRRLL